MSEPGTSPETTETIVLDYDLEEPPHQVWRALTEPHLLAAWLGPNNIRPEVGHRFSVETAEPGRDSEVHCEVLDVDPKRSITYSWREARDGAAALDSRVTWTLTPTFVGGTHLRLVHDGFAWSGGRILAVAGGAGRRISRALAWRVTDWLADVWRLAA
jgi:uncharacterized protein YndB with AHSA1/START domain